jgi:hypothetical protein
MRLLIELTIVALVLVGATCLTLNVAKYSIDAKQGMYQYYGGK